jgi:uncharacterized lipoprotein
MKFGTVRVLTIAVMALTATGCHMFRHHTKSCHKPQPYMNAQSVAPLQIPPGLDTPDTTNALRIPRLDAPPPPPRKGQEPCLDEPPPFNVQKPVKPQA